MHKVDLIYEIANVHALQCHPAALTESRRWYAVGYKLLRQMPEVEDRIRMEVRLDNGLALVEYHAQRHHEALALERHAKNLTQQAASEYHGVARWAIPLLNINTAKLLIKRFADLPAAMQLIEGSLPHCDPVAKENAFPPARSLILRSGQLSPRGRRLTPLYEWESPVTLDELGELSGRLIFTISLLCLGEGERARQQLPRLTYLCHAVASPGATPLLTAVRQALETPIIA